MAVSVTCKLYEGRSTLAGVQKVIHVLPTGLHYCVTYPQSRGYFDLALAACVRACVRALPCACVCVRAHPCMCVSGRVRGRVGLWVGGVGGVRGRGVRQWKDLWKQ